MAVIKLLRANPEEGRAFYEHFEVLREELIASKWGSVNPLYSRKCNIAAEFIQAEVLNQFNLKDLSRKD